MQASSYRNRRSGLADVFHMLAIPYDSEDAQKLNHDIFETIYYASVKQSVELSKQHGSFSSFIGSPASQGKFNFDLWGHQPSNRYDWTALRHDGTIWNAQQFINCLYANRVQCIYFRKYGII